MTPHEREEFAVMKNEISHIKSDVAEMKEDTKVSINEIKDMLKEHVEWEAGKYDSLQNSFAAKWVEKVILGISVTVAGAIIVGLIQLL